MAGYLSRIPPLVGITNPLLSKNVSLGDNAIGSLLDMDGSSTYSAFVMALDNHRLSTAPGTLSSIPPLR